MKKVVNANYLYVKVCQPLVCGSLLVPIVQLSHVLYQCISGSTGHSGRSS